MLHVGLATHCAPPAASGLVGSMAVPSLQLRLAAVVRPVIRTRVPAKFKSAGMVIKIRG